MTRPPLIYLDALHGEVRFDDPIASLIAAPIVQRLRHVRLSNIDSIAMPGIANLSRYEHVLGVAHLSRCTGLRRSLPTFDQLALTAAALLHDWAITAFGHLVEEAFNYLNAGFDHEEKLHTILSGGADVEEIGGVNRQILAGRQTNLRAWANDAVGPARGEELLIRIEQLIRGKDTLGPLVSGTMDLDNMDNVYRIAFHMGLQVDRDLPVRLAQAIVAVTDAGTPVFAESASEDVEAWVATRREVYSRLMPAQPDFSYKIMILYAATQAIDAGEIGAADWHLTDHGFIDRLANSKIPAVRETLARWTAGEAWNVTPLWWLDGQRPTYAELFSFSKEVGARLGRTCFAYGIKDKRERRLEFDFDGGSTLEFGTNPKAWLLGVGCAKREAFTRMEAEKIVVMAKERFAVMTAPVRVENRTSELQEACLL